MHDELRGEMERSKETAARLLETLAKTVRRNRSVRAATGGMERAAHYVQSLSVKDVASGIERAARRSPASAMAVAAVAGFLIGRALRSR